MVALTPSEVGMDLGFFAICFVVGAGAIALWADARYPALAPSTARNTILHVGATILVAQVLIPVAFKVLTGSEVLALVAVFAVALPALVYCLLVGIWVLKLMQGAVRGRFR